MPRVLLVEDEDDLREILAYNFRSAGFDVACAARGRDALRLARDPVPDLVLLDLMLPDISGLEVCRTLKADPITRDTPILVLTAKGEEMDRVVGFELGADDYVVKPFSVRELLLRAQAILRRGRTAPAEASRDAVFGVLRIDRGAHRVWVGEDAVELTALELRLLLVLFDRRDRVQTRTVLLDDVWGIKADVTTRTVDTHVKRLREKLGAAGDYVETVRGVGYRFIAAVP
jgi:two-component system, OmpR family, phosphate regulon response regulator PhoB